MFSCLYLTAYGFLFLILSQFVIKTRNVAVAVFVILVDDEAAVVVVVVVVCVGVCFVIVVLFVQLLFLKLDVVVRFYYAISSSCSF